MTNQNLRLLLTSILMLLETDHVDEAIEVIKKGIDYIDNSDASNSNEGGKNK